MWRSLIVGAVAVWLAACGSRGDEVSRVTSPTGAVDAVLLETNGGATTSFGYEAHLVKKGGPVSKGTLVAKWYGAVRSEAAYGVNLRWKDGGTLALEFLSAKSQHLERSAVSIGGNEVKVDLVPGVADPKAPAGGMLYNLQGRPHG